MNKWQDSSSTSSTQAFSKLPSFNSNSSCRWVNNKSPLVRIRMEWQSLRPQHSSSRFLTIHSRTL